MKSSSQVTICMISCLHPLKDDRIYWKEAISLKKNGYNIVHLGVSDEVQDFITKEGIRLISVKRIRYFNNILIDKLFRLLTFRPNIYNQLIKIAEQLQADVYHLHDLQLNRIGPRLKKLPHEPKIIYDVHEPYPQGIAYRHNYTFLLKFIRLLYGYYIKKWQFIKASHYDLIITTEENVASHFKGALPNKSVEIIYNYSNLHHLHQKKDTEKIYDAIYSGGLSSFRGAWTILNALKTAKDKQVNLKVLILGNIKEKGLKSRMIKFISEHKLEDMITLKSSVPYEEVGNYYNKSRCGLVVFNNNPVYHILMPIKTFEYLYYGLPVITSNIGHTHQMIQKHHCGIGIKPESAEALFQALKKYKTDNATFEKHSKKAHKAFMQNYTWELMEKKLIKIYKSLIIQT